MATVLFLALARSIGARAVLLGVLVQCTAFLCFDTVGELRARRSLSRIENAMRAPAGTEGLADPSQSTVNQRRMEDD